MTFVYSGKNSDLFASNDSMPFQYCIVSSITVPRGVIKFDVNFRSFISVDMHLSMQCPDVRLTFCISVKTE